MRRGTGRSDLDQGRRISGWVGGASGRSFTSAPRSPTSLPGTPSGGTGASYPTLGPSSASEGDWNTSDAGVYPRSRLDTATPRRRPRAAIPSRADRDAARARTIARRRIAVAAGVRRGPRGRRRPAVGRHGAADRRRAGRAGRIQLPARQGPGDHHQPHAAIGAERRGPGSRSRRQGDDGRALLPRVRRPGLVGRLRGGVRALRRRRGRARRPTPRSSRSGPPRTTTSKPSTSRAAPHGLVLTDAKDAPVTAVAEVEFVATLEAQGGGTSRRS